MAITNSYLIKCDYKLQYTLNEINCVIEQTNGFLRCYGPKFKRREFFLAKLLFGRCTSV